MPWGSPGRSVPRDGGRATVSGAVRAPTDSMRFAFSCHFTPKGRARPRSAPGPTKFSRLAAAHGTAQRNSTGSLSADTQEFRQELRQGGLRQLLPPSPTSPSGGLQAPSPRQTATPAPRLGRRRTHTYTASAFSGIYASIPATDQAGYLEYLEGWPINAEPEAFGLHENAEITYARYLLMLLRGGHSPAVHTPLSRGVF